MKLLRCSDSSQKMQRPHLLCASFPFKKTKTKHENGCCRHPKRLFWFDIKLCQFISQNLLQCAAHTASSYQKQKQFHYLSILSCQKRFHYFVKAMNKNLKCLKREKSAVHCVDCRHFSVVWNKYDHNGLYLIMCLWVRVKKTWTVNYNITLYHRQQTLKLKVIFR